MTQPDAATALFDTWAVDGQAEGMEAEHQGPVLAALDIMDLKPGERILDLGCGNGWVTRRLAQLTGAPTMGIDGAARMVARATDLSLELDNVSFQHARFESLPFEDGAFDRVFSMEALYYPADTETVIAEIARVLGANGRAEILIHYYAENPATHIWPKLLDLPMRCLTEKEWRTLFADQFKEAETRRVMDPSGVGSADDFTPDDYCPDWQSWVSFKEAGTLWIRAHK